MSLLATIIAVVALTIAVIDLSAATDSRRDSARDSCRLLLGLVKAATTNAPQQQAAAQAYIRRTPLSNCNDYAKAIIR